MQSNQSLNHFELNVTCHHNLACTVLNPSLISPSLAGAPETAAPDRATGVPHGAVEVCRDEGSSADGTAGGRSRAAERRRASRTSSARPTYGHAPRTSWAPWSWISPHAPPHGSPSRPSNRSALLKSLAKLLFFVLGMCLYAARDAYISKCLLLFDAGPMVGPGQPMPGRMMSGPPPIGPQQGGMPPMMGPRHPGPPNGMCEYAFHFIILPFVSFCSLGCAY